MFSAVTSEWKDKLERVSEGVDAWDISELHAPSPHYTLVIDPGAAASSSISVSAATNHENATLKSRKKELDYISNVCRSEQMQILPEWPQELATIRGKLKAHRPLALRMPDIQRQVKSGREGHDAAVQPASGFASQWASFNHRSRHNR